MHPRLVSKKNLRVATPSRVREVSFLAMALLVGTLAAATARAGLSYRQPVAPPNPAQVLKIPMLAGTRLSRPPTSFDLVPKKGTQTKGQFVFIPKSGKFPIATSRRLFDYYVSTMTTNGWNVAARSRPTSSGEWALSLSLGPHQATITMYMAPTASLTLDSCPPFAYC